MTFGLMTGKIDRSGKKFRQPQSFAWKVCLNELTETICVNSTTIWRQIMTMNFPRVGFQWCSKVFNWYGKNCFNFRENSFLSTWINDWWKAVPQSGYPSWDCSIIQGCFSSGESEDVVTLTDWGLVSGRAPHKHQEPNEWEIIAFSPACKIGEQNLGLETKNIRKKRRGMRGRVSQHCTVMQ